MNPVVIVALAPVHPSEFAIYATKAVLIFLFVLVAFRLLGKRHAGSFNVYDVATLMAASNAVQNAMTGGRGNLPVGLIVSSAIVGTAWLLNRTLARNPRLQPPVLGSPTILITHGHILEARLKRQHITHAELSAALRAHSINQIDQVALAVLERNGAISIVPEPSPIDPKLNGSDTPSDGDRA